VNIHLVLPDVTDKPIADVLGTPELHELLHLGGKVYRWNPGLGWSARKMLHTKAWLIDYEEEKPTLAYLGSANLTQRSHLADNETGVLSLSPEFAREVYERIFNHDISSDSRLETMETFHIRWSENALVRSARALRKLFVNMFWFF